MFWPGNQGCCEGSLFVAFRIISWKINATKACEILLEHENIKNKKLRNLKTLLINYCFIQTKMEEDERMKSWLESFLIYGDFKISEANSYSYIIISLHSIKHCLSLCIYLHIYWTAFDAFLSIDIMIQEEGLYV